MDPEEVRREIRAALGRLNGGSQVYTSFYFSRRLGAGSVHGPSILEEEARAAGLQLQRFGPRGGWEVRRPLYRR